MILKKSFLGFFFAFICYSQLALAEYRVFTLLIVNEKTKENRQFDSTLDPDQYTSFHPLKSDEKIYYIKTWRCRGRTDGFKPHCLPPSAELQEQAPEILPENTSQN
ncbi:MAG: hypothetical protein ACK41T_05960 [Pseudobdellovibrio sp.]